MWRFLLILSLLAGCARDLVATVNGLPITRATYEQALRIALMQHDPILVRDTKRWAIVKQQVLDQLIIDTLLAHEAESSGIRPSENELAEMYNQYKGQYTEEAFQEMLSAKGIVYEAWKTFRRQRYLIEQLTAARAGDAEAPTAEAVERYYREHRADFSEPEAVRVRQIVTESETTAKTLREKILKGANFAQLAAEYSLTPDGKEGGDLGYIPRGTFPEVFDRVCFRLPVGAMSDVVKSEYGYHLFKVLDRRPARVLSLADARPRILEELRRGQGVEQYAQWVEETRALARITINTEQLARATVQGLPYEK